MALQWSPADLDRQRRVMGLALERAEAHRLRLSIARRELAQRLHAIAVPVAVSAAAVAAAFALGRYVSVRAAGRDSAPAPAGRAPSGSGRVQSLLALAMTLSQIYLRARTLIAPPAHTAAAGPER